MHISLPFREVSSVQLVLTHIHTDHIEIAYTNNCENSNLVTIKQHLKHYVTLTRRAIFDHPSAK